METFEQVWEEKFSKGNRVEIVNPWYEHSVGKLATVTKVVPGDYRPIKVRMDDGDHCTYTFWDIEKIDS